MLTKHASIANVQTMQVRSAGIKTIPIMLVNLDLNQMVLVLVLVKLVITNWANQLLLPKSSSMQFAPAFLGIRLVERPRSQRKESCQIVMRIPPLNNFIHMIGLHTVQLVL